jgi:hypothetical protein
MRRALALAAVLCTASAASAHDPWEYVLYNSWDDDSSTLNFLTHGTVQRGHDLETVSGLVDQDWYTFQAQSRHSYEIRVTGGVEYWGFACTGGECPRVDLVDQAGGLVVPATPEPDELAITINRGPTGPQPAFRSQTIRFIAAASFPMYVRVLGDQAVPAGPGKFYDISFRDTTVFGPRWNNSGTQVSVVVVQNQTAYPQEGTLDFYGADGTLLYSGLLVLAPHGVYVFNTSTIPALAGRSGSLVIPHEGAYGALGGKVVALEPATGFTFDTLLAPMPY